MQVIPVILATAEQDRLSNLSFENMPKQFLKIGDSEDSLFKQAVRRATEIARLQDIFIVTLSRYKNVVYEQIEDLEIDKANIIFETENKNTLASFTLASLIINERYERDKVVWFVPSEQLISSSGEVLKAVSRSFDYAQSGKVVCFGVSDGDIVNDNGVFQVGEKLDNNHEVFAVKELRLEASNDNNSNNLVNTGMLLIKAQKILDDMSVIAPGQLNVLTKAFYLADKGDDGVFLNIKDCQRIDGRSFNKVILQDVDDLMVCSIDAKYSTVSSWYQLWQMSQGEEGKDSLDKFLKKISGAA